MKRVGILTAAVAAAVLSFTTCAMAQEHGTKDEAKTMVNAAVQHVQKVGPEQAFKDFNTDAHWIKKDLYVIVCDMKGNVLANGGNPKRVGHNTYELKDPNGFQVIAEMGELAQTKGEGWINYVWPHPQTKKFEDKTSYVRKLPGFDGWVAVGVYR